MGLTTSRGKAWSLGADSGMMETTHPVKAAEGKPLVNNGLWSLRFSPRRRTQTGDVLFADVKGSMDLAEQLEAEEWHKIMDRFFAILSEGIHRFEGTINQYTGDGIMALFGAPIAREDHANVPAMPRFSFNKSSGVTRTRCAWSTV